ncbi:hypothetical protein H2200_008836 [Cladophialophora chaetospira]|uniref:Enoyl reductase (ER) domain-containing protein n=1 Tax=Cladophialophora chaetospira TaxID=386627 RepID=A0AA38X4Y2_9EURO|nr:hypothetical protein H2200_008836 [Cladophialophora chaetospira]
MSTQKAVAVVAKGQPVQLIERPIPKPKAGEVLVKVSIAGLNPHDGLVRDIAYFIGEENLPAVLSIDIVGEVVQVGDAVTAFKIGDKVMGQGDPAVPDTNGTQEYALLDADFTAHLPASISPDQANTIILNVLTSYLAVFGPGFEIPSPLSTPDKSFDYGNTTIVVVGGGSACGKFAIQLAAWAGIGTIITVAGKTGEVGLRFMGATHVIDRSLSEEDIRSEIHSITGDELLYVLDCINRDDHTPSVRLLSDTKKGTFVPLAVSRPNTIDESKVGPKKEGYVFKKFVARLSLFREIAKEFYQVLPKLIDEGVLRPTAFEVIEGLDVGMINAQLDKFSERAWPSRVNVHVQ